MIVSQHRSRLVRRRARIAYLWPAERAAARVIELDGEAVINVTDRFGHWLGYFADVADLESSGAVDLATLQVVAP